MVMVFTYGLLFHWFTIFSPLVADLGTNSVSGTLSSLQNSNANPRDDFDMFAQTRGSSLAEQRKK